ncbi:MAG: hypothetical protein JSW60_01350 [Thermoplasmatales archaeon]|nr:MAG: hypothetical protein JSW60_01350 [Thermoplasmatales archaeon]
MNKRIMGIFICTLLIATAALPAAGTGKIIELNKINNISRKSLMESIVVTLNVGEYEINDYGMGNSEINMAGFGSILYPGEPMLPSKTFYVGMPPGCEVISVDLLNENCEEVAGRYHIRSAPPVFGGENTKVNGKENLVICPSEGPFPAKVYEYIGMSQMRKYYLAMIRFSPFSYYPSEGKLVLHNSITLRISFRIVEEVSDELLADAAMDDVASECIVNYAEIAHLYQPTSVPPMEQTYDYVIITTSSLVGSLSGFQTWKTSLGYSVTIKTLSWITTQYPASDTQESIRNFLVANYASWGIKYVLIVGSHSTVPMRTCYPDPNDHNNDGQHDIPNDYYYADLTGNWDSDGDGFYGERGQDSVDFNPEVWVGRIPVDTGTTVTNICTKIQNFEQTAYMGWKKNAMLLGAVYSYLNEDYSGNPRWDGAEVQEQVRTNLLAGFSCTTMYEKAGLAPCSYTCTYSLTNANIITQWGSTTGWGIVNWAAHGWYTSASRKIWSSDDSDNVPETAEMTWPIMIQNTDSTSFNDNKPPIVFAASCYVERPETSNNLGASLLIQGASAFAGATRVSWGSMGWTQPSHGGHGTISYDFVDRIANGGQDCGTALYDAKLYVYNNYPWNGWWDYANMYDFNLYGDPSMGMNLQPNTPSQPSGPTSGLAGKSYTYTTSTTDPTSDMVKYGWDWDGDNTVDEWDDNGGNYYTSGTTISTSHAWGSTGTFNVKVKAEDLYGGQSAFSPHLTVVITTTAPNKPATPSGETRGKIGTPYPYSTMTNDPDSDKVKYGWDWDGDNTVDEWDDNGGNFYASGTTITTYHSWDTKGTYDVKVKAQDLYGGESVWSDPLEVTMPKNNLFINTWFPWFWQWFPRIFPIIRNLFGL